MADTSSATFITPANKPIVPMIPNLNDANLINNFKGIELYIAYLQPNLYDSDVIRNEIHSYIRKTRSSFSQSESDESHMIHLNNKGYTIQYIDRESINSYYSNPLYNSVLSRAFRLAQENQSDYIILYLPNSGSDSNSIMRSNDPNDESYWTQNTNYLNYKNGYIFRYLDAETSVNTNYFTPDNLSGSLNWQTIATMGVKLAAKYYKNGQFIQTVTSAIDSLSNIIDIYNPPISVTYSNATGSSLRSKASGTCYVRDIFIRDNLDRISGFLYYSWATVEYSELYLRTETRWPISYSAGAYHYAEGYNISSMQTYGTPGYNNNSSSILTTIIALYENTSGYFTHSETLNINSAILSLTTN